MRRRIRGDVMNGKGWGGLTWYIAVPERRSLMRPTRGYKTIIKVKLMIFRIY